MSDLRDMKCMKRNVFETMVRVSSRDVSEPMLQSETLKVKVKTALCHSPPIDSR
jgi:hypothetical protein